MMQPFRTTTVNVKFMQSSIECICSQFAIHYKVISDLSFFISKTEPPSMSNIHNLNNPAQELCNLPLFPRSPNQAKITDRSLFIKGNNAWYIYISESLYLKSDLLFLHHIPKSIPSLEDLSQYIFWLLWKRYYSVLTDS